MADPTDDDARPSSLIEDRVDVVSIEESIEDDDPEYFKDVKDILRQLGLPATLVVGEPAHARLARMYSCICMFDDDEGIAAGETLPVFPPGFADWEAVNRAFRHMGEPVRYFGETDEMNLERLDVQWNSFIGTDTHDTRPPASSASLGNGEVNMAR